MIVGSKISFNEIVTQFAIQKLEREIVKGKALLLFVNFFLAVAIPGGKETFRFA